MTKAFGAAAAVAAGAEQDSSSDDDSALARTPAMTLTPQSTKQYGDFAYKALHNKDTFFILFSALYANDDPVLARTWGADDIVHSRPT